MPGLDLTWKGGEHWFDLPIDQMRALQDRCDAGPAWILNRLATQQWRIDDVVSTIRFGLEGGGMDKEAARALVRKHVEGEPLAQFVTTAQAILMVALYGPPEDPVGEPPAGESDTTLSRGEKSDGRASTAGAPSSVSARAPSGK